MRPPVLSCLLACLAAAHAQDVPAPPPFAEARALAQRLCAERASPAIAIAVLQDDEVVWAEGFGTADFATGRAATADTMFRLASISKPFTATALMCLCDDGVLELDQPVNRYLTGSQMVAHRGDAAAITLRRLANHTAGMPTHWCFFYGGGGPPRDETIRRYGFAGWAPGTVTCYSNLAFGVLDHVIAVQGRQPFGTFLQQRVLAPLAMHNTSLGMPEQRERTATGYRPLGGGLFLAVVDYGFDHDGASAVWSSARDLMQFARLQIHDGEVDGKRVLRAESARAMRTVHGEVGGNHYGVAWRVDRERGHLRLSHSGGMPGVATMLQVFPEARAAVAVLTNTRERRAEQECTRAILPVLLPEVAAAAPDPAATVIPRKRAPADVRPGTFRGKLRHHDGDLTVELVHAAKGQVELRLDGKTVPAKAIAPPGRLIVECSAPLPTIASYRGTPDLTFDLEVDGDLLAGVCYAAAGSLFHLPHWVELRRE